jgi:hypothetical protein
MARWLKTFARQAIILKTLHVFYSAAGPNLSAYHDVQPSNAAAATDCQIDRDGGRI